MYDRDDTVRGGRWLDTLDMRGSGYRFYSILVLDIQHGHHHYHPYRRSEKQYFPYELQKGKPPTF